VRGFRAPKETPPRRSFPYIFVSTELFILSLTRAWSVTADVSIEHRGKISGPKVYSRSVLLARKRSRSNGRLP